MNKELSFFTDLDDEGTEMLLRHSSYSEKSLNNIKSKVERKTSKRTRVHKRILITVAAVALFGTGIAAAAANSDTVYRLLFGEHAAYMRDHSRTIDIAAEADGIEVRMLSAFKYAGSFTMVVSIRDKEGDRIDESTAFDSIADFGGAGKERFNHLSDRQDSFNEETGEFIRVETIALPPGFDASDISYTVANLRSRRAPRSGPESQIDLYGFVSNHTPSILPEIPAGSETQGRPKSLAPEETHIAFSDVDWSYISNMGFVDGVLHIQVKDDSFIINDATRGKRGWLFPIYLVDSDGTKYGFENPKTYHFPIKQYWEPEKQTYTEFVFGDITDIAQLAGMTLAKEGYEYTETFNAVWSLDEYAETLIEGSYFDAGLTVKFKAPGEEESLTVPVNREIPAVPGIEVYAESIVVTPLYADVTYLAADLKNSGRFFNSIGIPGGVTTFDLTDNPSGSNFITYDDGTIFEFEYQTESFSEYSDELGMYKAVVRYSRENVLSGEIINIIEVDRVKSVTIQGVEFEAE
jgi:hypothetical protein